MKTLLALVTGALLAGCAYAPPQQSSAVYIAPDATSTYRPLPREERRVTMCSMSGQHVRCW